MNNNNNNNNNMNNNNNNNNNSNNSSMNNVVTIDFSARLLQEMIGMRSSISQQAVQLNALNDAFRQQFAAPPSQERPSSGQGILSPEYRSQLLANSNRRGDRIINSNVLRKPKASPVERYNAMLQHLHRLGNNSTLPELTNGQLKSRREKLHRAAKRMVQTILVMNPDITHWSALSSNEDQQRFYCLALEEEVLQREGLMICLCKQQWCAKLLLQQAFKSHREAIGRAALAAAKADAAAVNVNAAPSEFVTGGHQEGGSSSIGEHGAAGAAGAAGFAGAGDDDDNLSTTSNM